MKPNSRVIITCWNPLSDFPTSTPGFWGLNIDKGSSNGYSTIEAEYHNTDGTLGIKWFGFYAITAENIIWKQLTTNSDLQSVNNKIDSKNSLKIIENTNNIAFSVVGNEVYVWIGDNNMGFIKFDKSTIS